MRCTWTAIPLRFIAASELDRSAHTQIRFILGNDMSAKTVSEDGE